jgi:hypothetical protein
LLTLQERKDNWKNYIKSPRFGIDTWRTLFIFQSNFESIKNTITLYLLLEKGIVDGKLPSLNSLNILRVKQNIYVDITSKLSILIETTIVLIDALSYPNYKKIPHNLVYYDYKQIYSIIKKLRKNNPPYSFRKILGLYYLPKVSDLSKQEKKIIGKIYSKTEKMMISKVKNIIEFYDNFRIVYGKSKHGLTIYSGIVEKNNTNFELDKSLLICYDRKTKDKIPQNHINLKPNNDINYFNILSYMLFDENLTKKIENILSDLNTIIDYICSNHLTYAMNCGDIYLPHTKKDNKTIVNFLDLEFENEEDRIFFNNLCNKIVSK